MLEDFSHDLLMIDNNFFVFKSRLYHIQVLRIKHYGVESCGAHAQRIKNLILFFIDGKKKLTANLNVKKHFFVLS